MNENNSLPVAAARKRTTQTNASSSPETGLLINVIRSLTSSVSEDQREIEKARLEKGFRESGELIDRLVKNHQADVDECLDSFRDVSAKVSDCRERIRNVKNALQTCKSLLELKRDDLKKLWLENAQQKAVCEILAQIEKLREGPAKIECLIAKESYQNAAAIVTESREIMNGKMSRIEGLSQLRNQIENYAQILFEKINDTLVTMLIIEPFEKHLMTIVRTIPEHKVHQNQHCSSIYEKMRNGFNVEPAKTRLSKAVEALSNLEGGNWDIDRLKFLCKNMMDKMISISIQVMRIGCNIDENNDGEQAHLKQFVQMLSAQLDSSCALHAEFAELIEKQCSRSDVVISFWKSAQSALEVVISEHLDINTSIDDTSVSNDQKALFRFDCTACASSPNVASSNSQPKVVICKPSAYNIVAIFPILSRLMENIEKQINESPCELRRFMHSFVMEMFVERVKTNLASRIESALRGGDSLRAPVDNKILPSCRKVLELCKEVHDLIISMDLYADRFAALWLLVLTDYYKNMTDVYDRMTPSSVSENDAVATRKQKLSATWTADDDISRLLMSLPNWHAANLSPTTPSVESEQDVGERSKRESEILIGNLGTQTQNKLTEAHLITDMNDIRMFASLHESLRWFSDQIRELVYSLPAHVRLVLDTCMVQVRLKDGQMIDNKSVPSAIEDCVRRLETIADSCLLLLHIEIRFHCFYHLSPLAKYRNSSIHNEVDPEVVTLGKDLQQFYNELKDVLSASKLSYIFDGLGHLCASIFIHLSQFMPRLTEAAKKRVCRNVWGVQQRLSRITNRRESDLDKARAFFDLLLTNDPDGLLSIIPEKRSMFTPIELSYLLALSVRSDKTLASQHGALEKRQLQLNAILKS
ncbi:unnamed protein product [Caenorhabditis bovis]|uniref:Exocyst complex component Sec8 n=1 Tax=Caenorhabditis bovis TaxID=2654633 RepID=A0A8S1F9C6_9PELO|nr:unnamed protein product [Caenorhabditis bovis]